MNFFAHMFIARDTDASRIGHYLGDFVKGTPESLVGEFPEAMVEAIVEHRAVDAFTDDHPEVVAMRDLLRPDFGRLTGVALDVVFDHFLHKHWERWSNENKDEFVEACYQSLAKPVQGAPERYVVFAEATIEYDLLNLYETLGGVGEALWRIGRRFKRPTQLTNTVPVLEKHYLPLESAFLAFFPDLLTEFASHRAV